MNLFACFAKKAFLLANHSSGLFQLFGDGYAHPIDDIEDSLFIHQEPPAKWYAPPFCKRIF